MVTAQRGRALYVNSAAAAKARLDPLEHVRGGAALTRRATAAPGSLKGEDVLQLQRLVGNRAVTQLVGGGVTAQRSASIRHDLAGDPRGQRQTVNASSRPGAGLQVQRVFGRNMRQRIRANDFSNLQEIAKKGEKGDATRPELEKAIRKVERYKKAARKMKGIDVAPRLDTLRMLGDDLGLAIDRFRVGETQKQAKGIYLEEARRGGLKALTKSSEGYFREGLVPRLAATEHGLDQSESASLSAYTANDYEYINPAAAYNKPWMQSQQEARMLKGTEKERFEEGGLHAAMMMSAMAKLPVWKGKGYRGERLSPTKFAEQYSEENGTVTAKEPTQVKAAFWSVSTDEDVARGFTQTSSQKDNTVSVFYIIDVGNARDVQGFSQNANEEEVLCPAGSKVTVSKIEKLDKGPAGFPVATAWYNVYLSQS
jgi:hypothetical protein